VHFISAAVCCDHFPLASFGQWLSRQYLPCFLPLPRHLRIIHPHHLSIHPSLQQPNNLIYMWHHHSRSVNSTTCYICMCTIALREIHHYQQCHQLLQPQLSLQLPALCQSLTAPSHLTFTYIQMACTKQTAHKPLGKYHLCCRFELVLIVVHLQAKHPINSLLPSHQHVRLLWVFYS
jgi:hypothetical protein